MSGQPPPPPPPPQQQQQAVYGGDMSYQRPMGVMDIAFGIALQFGFDLLQRAITSPSDRLILLSTVEGELKQQGRLPPVTGFGGIVKCVKRIYRKEGLSGFLRGVLTDTVLAFPAMLVDGIATNIVFSLLQVSLPMSIQQNLGPLEVAVLSIAATGAAVLVATPVNAIRKTISTNYAADIVAPVSGSTEEAEAAHETAARDGASEATATAAEAEPSAEEGYRYGNAQECARTIYRYGGWRAFYRGALVDPLTMCVYRGLYVMASMSVPVYYQAYHPHAVARALAVVADVATQPFEVVGRRLVMTASADADEAMAVNTSAHNGADDKSASESGAAKKSSDHRYRYEGALDCVQTIMREEGWQALFAGLRCRLAMTAGSMVLRATLNAFAGGGEHQDMDM